MKQLFITLAAAALLASCSKSDQELQNQSGVSIAFGAPEGMTPFKTRGSDNDLAVDNATMSVLGYYTTGLWKDEMATATPNLFYRQEVTFDGSNWVYSPTKNWSLSGYHHFFAFSPWGIAGTETANITQPTDTGAPFIVYQVPPDAADHTDVLWAWESDVNAGSYSPLINIAGMAPGASKVVNFNFRHALTKIAFQAKVGAGLDNNRYTITRIALQDVFYEAKSSFKADATFDAYTGATWTLAGMDKKQDFTVSTPASRGLSFVPLTTTTQPLTSANGYLYMLPQQIEKSTKGNDPTISITVYDTTDDISRVVTMKLKSPDIYDAGGSSGTDGTGDGWWQEQSIVYTLTYNGGGDIPMSIVAMVTPWADQLVPIVLPATYLNVDKIVVNTVVGDEVTIYYATDGSPISYFYDPSGTVYSGNTLPAASNFLPLTDAIGSFTFTVAAGTTYAYITAGKLTRNITITVN